MKFRRAVNIAVPQVGNKQTSTSAKNAISRPRNTILNKTSSTGKMPRSRIMKKSKLHNRFLGGGQVTGPKILVMFFKIVILYIFHLKKLRGCLWWRERKGVIIPQSFQQSQSLVFCSIPHKHTNQRKSLVKQGGRTWQAFGGGKHGHETFRQASNYNFRDKCVVFARNLKFLNLTQ